MTVDEMRAKAKRDKCGKCFGAVDVTKYGVKSVGCILDRKKHWECEGAYSQQELMRIMDEEINKIEVDILSRIS